MLEAIKLYLVAILRVPLVGVRRGLSRWNLVEFDPLIVGILVGLIGIALWIVTNWHLVRTGRAIKTEIDEKRAATEAFVQGELATLREDLGGAVELDAAPLMKAISAELLPEITDRVENIKATLLGKLGYGIKGVKALGEGVLKATGEKALEEAGYADEWEYRLAQIGIDEEWMKRNKAAAAGLLLLKRGFGQSGQGTQIVGGVPAGAKVVGPPRGFG